MKDHVLTFDELCGIAKQDFYTFCVILKSRFYLPNRKYLFTLCHTLQDFYENKIINKNGDIVYRVMINLPPRHGKSLTVDMFTQWILGLDPKSSVIRACYNETLSGRSAKTVRDGIQEIKQGRRIVYSDIFPKTKIKYGDSGYQLWSLEDSPFSFLATSPNGTITGVGCKWGIIDDLIKDAKEAYNERILDEHFDWYNNTFMSRLESGAKQLIVMTRWAKNDLCGKLLATNPDDWYVIKMPARQGDEMLSNDILSLKEYDKRKSAPGTDPIIFPANYDQEIIASSDLLYGTFKTYETRLEQYERIEAYVDTADEGQDYLAAMLVGVHNGLADVLDVLYTQAPMEITEIETAKMLTNGKCSKVFVESNSGGRSFARNVGRIMIEMKNPKTLVEWFHQSDNKASRILSNSSIVKNCIIFPKEWKELWPNVYYELTTASKIRKMLHDDLCLAKGTFIATNWGNVKIESVKTNMKALTPFGYKKILAARKTGKKEVIEKFGLIATKEHNIFSKNGFSPIDYLTRLSEESILSLRSLLLWKYKKLLFSMEKNINLWGRESIISVSQQVVKGESIVRDCMSRFGNFIIKGKFLKAGMFIISTETVLIITFLTWKHYQLRNILKNIREKLRKNVYNVSPMPASLLPNGIKAQPEERGIRSMGKNYGRVEKKKSMFAFFAKRIFSLKSIGHYFVPNRAEKNIEIKTINRDIAKQHNANYVVKHLLTRNINKASLNEDFVVPPVRQHMQTELEIDVYNLTIENVGVYYANGILVSNCDAITGVCEKIIAGQDFHIY